MPTEKRSYKDWKDKMLTYRPDLAASFNNNHANGGSLVQIYPQWQNLPLTEKAAYIKTAVANGIHDLPSIKEAYHKFATGGEKEENVYKPTQDIKDRISRYEGKSMTQSYIDPLSHKRVGKNRSFIDEAMSFTYALPKSIRSKVLSNPQLAKNLYSYSYNVGAANFKKRVVPILEAYYAGDATAAQVVEGMWASGDSKLRGLQRRRAEEREGAYQGLTGQSYTTPIAAQQHAPSFDVTSTFEDPYLVAHAEEYLSQKEKGETPVTPEVEEPVEEQSVQEEQSTVLNPYLSQLMSQFQASSQEQTPVYYMPLTYDENQPTSADTQVEEANPYVVNISRHGGYINRYDDGGDTFTTQAPIVFSSTIPEDVMPVMDTTTGQLVGYSEGAPLKEAVVSAYTPETKAKLKVLGIDLDREGDEDRLRQFHTKENGDIDWNSFTIQPWQAAQLQSLRNPSWREVYGMTPDQEALNAVTGYTAYAPLFPLVALASCTSKPSTSDPIAEEVSNTGAPTSNTGTQSGTITVGKEMTGPVFNPYTKDWLLNGEILDSNVFTKDYGKTVYTTDGFAVNYDKAGREMNRQKGTQTPYIGSRQQYFDVDKEFTDSVKVKAARYGLSPDLLASRLAHEGVVDEQGIVSYNESSGINQSPSLISNAGDFRQGEVPIGRLAYGNYGLDDSKSYAESNKDFVKEPWIDTETFDSIPNEHGRMVHYLSNLTSSDAISVMAAMLKVNRDKIKERYPNATDTQLDIAANAAYNLGLYRTLKILGDKGFSGIDKYKPSIKLGK